jgi:hypothetical protein
MILELRRYLFTETSTCGILRDVTYAGYPVFLCYTLENYCGDEKIKGKTCIPTGKYEIRLRTFGRLHEKYTKRFPDIHKGMLWLQDVPNFTGILMHIGNTEKDSTGCILLGDSVRSDFTPTGRYLCNSLSSSSVAYPRVYEGILNARGKDESLTINIRDLI